MMQKPIISLMYHDLFEFSFAESGFQNGGSMKYKIPRQRFEDQIKAMAVYCNGENIRKEEVCLTFDDGGKSGFRIIAPILEKYGFKGYFFIPTKFINNSGFLTNQEILELDNRGHIVGVHSHSHPQNISAIGFEQIKYEWHHSIDIISGILNRNVLYASVPNGFISNDSLSVLSGIGIKAVFTSRPSSSCKFQNGVKVIGRYTVNGKMNSDDVVNLMKPFSLIRIKQFTRWQIVNLIKQVLGRSYFTLKTLVLKENS